MSDLVGNPEDRFSRVAAHLFWDRLKMVHREHNALVVEYRTSELEIYFKLYESLFQPVNARGTFKIIETGLES